MIDNLCKKIAKPLENFEISFTPTRVLMQDFTGVPAVADLAAMRDALKTKVLILTILTHYQELIWL